MQNLVQNPDDGLIVRLKTNDSLVYYLKDGKLRIIPDKETETRISHYAPSSYEDFSTAIFLQLTSHGLLSSSYIICI